MRSPSVIPILAAYRSLCSSASTLLQQYLYLTCGNMSSSQETNQKLIMPTKSWGCSTVPSQIFPVTMPNTPNAFQATIVAHQIGCKAMICHFLAETAGWPAKACQSLWHKCLKCLNFKKSPLFLVRIQSPTVPTASAKPKSPPTWIQ